MGLLGRLKGAIGEASFNVKRAGTLGRMSIPGTGEMDLPAGKVRVTYEQSGGKKGGAGGFDPQSVPKAPQLPGMSVRSRAGGEPLEFRRFGGANVRAVGDATTRALVGSLVVPESGSYVIDVPEPFHDPVEQQFTHIVVGSEPKLLFDAA